jgi:hypothetical protein
MEKKLRLPVCSNLISFLCRSSSEHAYIRFRKCSYPISIYYLCICIRYLFVSNTAEPSEQFKSECHSSSLCRNCINALLERKQIRYISASGKEKNVHAKTKHVWESLQNKLCRKTYIPILRYSQTTPISYTKHEPKTAQFMQLNIFSLFSENIKYLRFQP